MGGGFAFGSALVVFAAGQRVLHHCVGDYQAEAGGDGGRGVLHGFAIEHDGVAGDAVDGYELIHDAAAGSGEFVFGLLAKEDELQAGELSGFWAVGPGGPPRTRGSAPLWLTGFYFFRKA